METALFMVENFHKVDKINTVDMKREDFYPLNIFLNTQIERSWVDQAKVELIRTLPAHQATESLSSSTNTRTIVSTT